jgi:DNA-binding CsgD family transcriptional regulator
MGGRPWLLIRGVEACLWSHQITDSRQTLGRASGCDIVLLNPTVSRVHAEIRQQNGYLFIRDLQSRNGTFVNDEPVTEAGFDAGDMLGLGSVTIDVLASPRSLTAVAVKTSLDMPREGRDPETALENLRAEHGLSPAEYEVLRLLAQGLAEKEVAARLHLSRHTVHAHTKRIYHAVGVHSRAELLATSLVGRPRSCQPSVVGCRNGSSN